MTNRRITLEGKRFREKINLFCLGVSQYGISNATIIVFVMFI